MPTKKQETEIHKLRLKLLKLQIENQELLKKILQLTPLMLGFKKPKMRTKRGIYNA